MILNESHIHFVFINGFFAEHLSNIEQLPKNIEKKTEQGLYLRVPAQCSVSQPIHILHVRTDLFSPITHHDHVIQVGAESHITLIEEYVSTALNQPYFNHVLTQIHLQSAATMQYYKIQNEHRTACHTAQLFVEQAKESVLKTFFLGRGALYAEETATLHLAESHAKAACYGLYYLNQKNQKMKMDVCVQHRATHGHSAVFYKGILDQNTESTFRSNTFVPLHAKETVASQNNHHLLLSKNAKAKSQPELEIHADAVQCRHGSTIGQLDEEALFYCQARGIPLDVAHDLLKEAFIRDVLKHITQPDMQNYIENQVGLYDVST